LGVFTVIHWRIVDIGHSSDLLQSHGSRFVDSFMSQQAIPEASRSIAIASTVAYTIHFIVNRCTHGI